MTEITGEQQWHWYWTTKWFNWLQLGAARVTSSDGEWAKEHGGKVVKYRPTFSRRAVGGGFYIGWVGTANWYFFVLGWGE